MRISATLLATFVILLCHSPSLKGNSADPQKRPNIVFILTDNQGAWTLGCYGNPEIRSPNIDRLAENGVLFTQAYASNPVCSPTRATYLTGLVPSQHGVHSFLSGGAMQTGPGAHSSLDEFTSLPQVLRSAGYACGLVGKWHLGGNLKPQEGLDDYWITMPHGGTSTFYDAQIIEDGEIRKEPTYLTDFWTEHATKFIDQQAGQEKPFFLFLAYNGPYALSRLLLREGQNRHAEYYSDKPMLSFSREPTHPWQYSNRDYANNPDAMRRVATEVSGVDDGVGAVMKALEKNGISDNTLVIYAADQGWVGGHGGFFGMGDHTRPSTARDGMMLVPTIWHHPPKIAKGVRSDHMVTNYDFMPTLLNYLGLGDKMPTSPPSPGKDYSPVLTQKDVDSVPAVRPVFYEYEDLRCVRTSRYKYVHRHPNGPHELYDMLDDPQEFNNLADSADHASIRGELKQQIDDFFGRYSLPKYDMWNGGGSQARIHSGVDEELAQLASVSPPDPPTDFEPMDLKVPDGYTVELVAAPPLVTHPTMGCFDDVGNLYVCNNSGVNLKNDELEEQLPNAIYKLIDSDKDGRFDRRTVFADKMTFPMGGAWHQGSLYVASPPHIWRLTDHDGDGIADERKAIAEKFGFNGNAASIHGCFFGPDGRLYWTDGYHGHEFRDEQGNITSSREGSYIFSCLPSGEDVRIHCGGGMDNPVEIDFTDAGDMLGTVNIMYHRPRVDAFTHWLHGGAYPHREKVLKEIKTTGPVLGPVHRFGHVAVSGATRYRSGTMDHRWRDNFFATFFNSGKVARLELSRSGSTFEAIQHEFVSCDDSEFHPTDVIEDADGSLLVIDTGGWFYHGCPTSQFAKPELLGGIYRIRREGMTTLVDPRGERLDWSTMPVTELMKHMHDTRRVVREHAINECVRRGESILPTIKTMITVARGDIRVRNNLVWALTRMMQDKKTANAAGEVIKVALSDYVPAIRQAACRSFGFSAGTVDPDAVIELLRDADPGVRREAAATLGRIGDVRAVKPLAEALGREMDRSEEHAVIYALIEIDQPQALVVALNDMAGTPRADTNRMRRAMTAFDQMSVDVLQPEQVIAGLESDDPQWQTAALDILARRTQWHDVAKGSLKSRLSDPAKMQSQPDITKLLIARYADDSELAAEIGRILATTQDSELQTLILAAITSADSPPLHPTWEQPLRQLVSNRSGPNRQAAITAIASINTDAFNEQLESIGGDSSSDALLRVSALAAVQNSSGELSDATFELLRDFASDATQPAASLNAVQLIAASKLKSSRLQKLAPLVATANPLQLRELVRCFGRSRDPKTIETFLASLKQAKSFLSLAPNELSDAIKRYPQEMLPQANQLLDRLSAHQSEKAARLTMLSTQLASGDAVRGRAVFFSEKAKCSSCHRIGEQGNRVGPELTRIGSNRSVNDLLESVVFPSASIVRDYDTFQVLTEDGRVLSGLMDSDSSNELVIQQASGEKVTVKRDEIEDIATMPTSLMPSALDETLSGQELADVVTYLKSLR
tara:strand:- start:805760 stop:810304 length:4545 start_codon:yes stop_codon:yes gene_type:complete